MSIDPTLRPQRQTGTAHPIGRVRINTLGCRLNEAECEDWAERFHARGLAIVGPDEPADLIVINTCAVTAEAVRKSRQILRRARRTNPWARLVVSGCLATLEDAALADAEDVDLIVTNADKDRLVEIAMDTLNVPTAPASAVTDAAAALFARGRQRAFIKVQDGCRYQCTFCVTTLARGAERSRPPEEVIARIRRYLAQDIQEVVLTGVHLGGYGSDLGTTLPALIERILGETDVPRLRLGSLEPWDLSTGFWRLFADQRLMPHLHLPLQSGSDRILKQMARRCKTAQFARHLEQGRRWAADLNVTTDLIVGFPGETDEDWARTLEFVGAMGLGQIHAFAYSRRPGTRAAELPDQVDPKTKRARLAELQDLAQSMRRTVLRAQIGKRVQVLCEGHPEGERPRARFGYTPNYLPTLIDDDVRAIAGNQRIEVDLIDIDPTSDALEARPAPRTDHSAQGDFLRL